MRAPRRSRFAWALSLGTGILLGWSPWRPAEPFRAAPPRNPLSRQGALEELVNAQLEQALIRAESTAHLLALLAAPSSQEDGP